MYRSSQKFFLVKKTFLFFILSFFVSLALIAQEEEIQYEVEAQAIGTTGGVVPFWMRSNQYGSIPVSGASGSFIGRAHREYENGLSGYSAKPKLIDWGMGFEGRVNAGKEQDFILTEAYLKGRLGPFQLKTGRSKETMGLTGDTSLTSGSFAISGNALGIPKVEISIPEYYTLPIFDGLFAVKGNFAHGWVGKLDLGKRSEVQDANTYFHQKSLYGTFGKIAWKLKAYGGFNHQAFWGNEKKINGNDYPLSLFESFKYVATGKGIYRSKLGNHLGSIDVGVELKFNNSSVKAYRQHFYDAGALGHFANIKDGLNGISILNNNISEGKIKWTRFTIEYLYTKHQGGELNSRPSPSGDDDYYNNYLYIKGWSYKSLGLGTPLLNTKISTRSELISDPVDYFINNRVQAYFLGVEGKVIEWRLKGKFAYSKNHGTYGTSTIGRITGGRRYPPRYGIFQEVPQLSAYLKGTKTINNQIEFACSIAIDKGGLLYESEGLILSLTKLF